MKELIGKKILKIELNDNNNIMIFTLEDFSKVGYQAEGDCCSSSWFNGINGVQNLLGAEVLDYVTKVEREENDGEIRYYGFTLMTSKGSCDIDFRNDSNGYYGGSCEYMGKTNITDTRFIVQDFFSENNG